MNTLRDNTKRRDGDNVNEEAPQVNQDTQGNESPINPPSIEDVEVKSYFLMLAQTVTNKAQAMTPQANRDVGTLVNPDVNYMEFRVINFLRMKPTKFHGSKVGENPQEFGDEVYMIVDVVG